MDTPQGIRYHIGYPGIQVPGEDTICHVEWGVYHYLHVHYCILSSHVLVQSTMITHGCWVTQSCICDCVHLSVGPKTCTKLLFDLLEFHIQISRFTHLPLFTLMYFCFLYLDIVINWNFFEVFGFSKRMKDFTFDKCL